MDFKCIHLCIRHTMERNQESKSVQSNSMLKEAKCQMIKNTASSESEVNFKNNNNSYYYSLIIWNHANIQFLLIYADKKISIGCASSASISCHFQAASFWVKKHNKTMVRNTIYVKMKTAPAKFHFGFDGSSSTERPLNIKFKLFFFFWERAREATGAGRLPSRQPLICATFGRGEGSVNQARSPPRGDRRAWHPNTGRRPLAVSPHCSHPWLITVRWCV